jgi:hypothetical protein
VVVVPDALLLVVALPVMLAGAGVFWLVDHV